MNLNTYRNKHLKNWFNDLTDSLDNFWETPFVKSDNHFLPACDFHETKDYYFFSFDVPGVKKEDINIELQDGTLHISGEKRNEYKEKQVEGKQFYEKFYGKFQRSFTLPTTVKEDAIEVHFKSGVLELLIPKKQATKGRKISVTDENNKNGLFSRLLKSGN